jgi:hypothetical protein
MVTAYEYRSVAAEAGGGPYRLNHGRGSSPLDRSYGGPGEPETWQQNALLLGIAALRLAVPVTLLLILLGAAYLYVDAFFPLAGLPASIRNAGLARNDLVLPCAWTCIHLTNRRLGPAYAFAQLVAALAICLVVILINPGHLDEWVPAITTRAVLSFGCAFLVANFVAILFFDGARGPHWWTAPLAASLAASFVFSAIYYPAALAGVTPRWIHFALVHVLFFSGMSGLLLGPYWLLRPAMRPVGGMNGY